MHGRVTRGRCVLPHPRAHGLSRAARPVPSEPPGPSVYQNEQGKRDHACQGDHPNILYFCCNKIRHGTPQRLVSGERLRQGE